MATRSRQKLTGVLLKSLNPKATPYNVADGDGLFVYVTNKGSKSWRYAYRFNGARRTVTFGLYPEVSLKRARELLAEARENLAAGRDPALLKQSAKVQATLDAKNTFEALARDWLAKKLPHWSESHRRDQTRRLEVDVLPYLGTARMVDLKAPDLLKAIEQVVPQGLETAKRARVIIQSVCRHGVNMEVIPVGPSTTLCSALEPPKPKHFAVPTDPSVIGGILRALESAGVAGPVVQCALMFHPHGCRAAGRIGAGAVGGLRF